MEPAICEHCGQITDIPMGVQVFCTLHEEQSQMLSIALLFKILAQGFPQKKIPEVKVVYDKYLKRMRELQTYILPPEQEAGGTPSPLKG